VDCVHEAPDRGHWRDLANKAIKPSALIKGRNLAKGMTISFRSTMFHGVSY